jgi:hypothetical protein
VRDVFLCLLCGDVGQRQERGLVHLRLSPLWISSNRINSTNAAGGGDKLPVFSRWADLARIGAAKVRSGPDPGGPALRGVSVSSRRPGIWRVQQPAFFTGSGLLSLFLPRDAPGLPYACQSRPVSGLKPGHGWRDGTYILAAHV